MDAFSRRELLLGATTALVTRDLFAADSNAHEPGHGTRDTPASLTTPPEAIISTHSGPVRGFRRNGIYIFRGVPYGSDPSGKARFLPAQPVKAWSTVRSCLAYGAVSPQPARRFATDELAFIADWNDGYPGEDCLTLNIWSGGLDPGSRKPVIVWLHGGGFVSGSSHELPSYEGSRLAARDAVVVSVNHRLGTFGFLDLSHYDGRYARSGNTGLLDIVLALRWVKANIAQFGGDPDRVTIAGQSGGGGKVSALMAMADAQGLFHRAVVMSGSFIPAQPQVEARALADALFDVLELRRGDIERLTQVSAARLVEAAETAVRNVHGPAAPPGLGRGRMGPIKGWGPVTDGSVLPVDTWSNSAPSVSRGVPMLVGNVRDEFKLSSMVFDEQGLRELASRVYGEKGAALLQAIDADFPSLGANDRAGVVSGIQFHNAAIDHCLLKARQQAAPVYHYWFVFAPDLLDGRVGAPHCADIAYFFDNAAACDQQTGNTPLANRVAEAMSSALIRFAGTGNPSGRSLQWTAFTEATRPTLVFGPEAREMRYPGARVFELARSG